jgi:hypothetical protein
MFHFEVRYANVLAQAALLLESGLVDFTFMTKSDVVLARSGTRQLGEPQPSTRTIYVKF